MDRQFIDIRGRVNLATPRNRRERVVAKWIERDTFYSWRAYNDDGRVAFDLSMYHYTTEKPLLAPDVWGTTVARDAENFHVTLPGVTVDPHGTEPIPVSWELMWRAIGGEEERLGRQPTAGGSAMVGAMHHVWPIHPGLDTMALAFLADLRRLISLREADRQPEMIPGLGKFDMATVERLTRLISDQFEAESYFQPNSTNNPKHLPSYPLAVRFADYNWKLALAQWRRYRLMQFGVTAKSWASGYWSLWQIPEAVALP